MSAIIQRNSPVLARCAKLVERADFDLKLANDAAQGAELPYSRRSKILRARRELGDLLREMKAEHEEKKGSEL